MTDSKKLDMLLEKMTGLDEKVSGLDKRVSTLEQDMCEMKTDLKQLHLDDNFILDEIERVHEILLNHMNNSTKHTA